ncbi:hypothetical protein PACTADRAFT_5153 [Pachysolen tannophilus NRRL Y-2460]|uniref:Uncharacterized protein n=1 Tax=Pachysolen tannophilus NRRL Y-2460 TaxID=669874 RepID=A0A1E4TNW6_PACTA|nr:hypothetical protein PACTADRAFT_5153 [Pachysolen tannophilus NRRL Y-2460]
MSALGLLDDAKLTDAVFAVFEIYTTKIYLSMYSNSRLLEETKIRNTELKNTTLENTVFMLPNKGYYLDSGNNNS